MLELAQYPQARSRCRYSACWYFCRNKLTFGWRHLSQSGAERDLLSDYPTGNKWLVTLKNKEATPLLSSLLGGQDSAISCTCRCRFPIYKRAGHKVALPDSFPGHSRETQGAQNSGYKLPREAAIITVPSAWRRFRKVCFNSLSLRQVRIGSFQPMQMLLAPRL